MLILASQFKSPHTRYPETYRLQCYRYSRRIYNLTTMMGCCGQHAVEEQGAPP
jgi:hypothetical protein